jgi:hypothetical protein
MCWLIVGDAAKKQKMERGGDRAIEAGNKKIP